MGSDAQADAHIAGDMIFGDVRERWEPGLQAWMVVGDAGPGADNFWDDED